MLMVRDTRIRTFLSLIMGYSLGTLIIVESQTAEAAEGQKLMGARPWHSYSDEQYFLRQ